MEIKIRPIKKRDNFALYEMIRNVFEEYNAPKAGTVYSDASTKNLYELFSSHAPKAILWVAEKNGTALGCCGIFPTKNLPDGCTELVKFYIDKSIRGIGIGKELMIKSEQAAKHLGHNSIYIESLPAFNDAVSIYQKNGYSLLEKPLGNSGHFGCDIWMLKKL